MQKETIKTQSISKNYGDFTAVSNLSLNISKQQIYGFIGLNGAGKTTTIRMLLGMIKPSSGSVIINGDTVDSKQTQIWKKVGYMVEVPFHYPNLSVRENLEIVKRLRMIDSKLAVDHVMDLLNITKYADRKAKDLSQGNSQRLGIAKALIHQPEIIILDEPTNALDPSGIVEIRNLLKHLSEDHGTTVFVSSHILGEVAKFATHIGIIHDGTLIKEMSSAELDRECAKKLILDTAVVQRTQDFLHERGISTTLDDNRHIQLQEEKLIDNPSELIDLLVHNECTPQTVTIHKEDLEAYFLRTIHTHKL